eukprot:1149138-Pelagomonas_calceolata.AAC.4
MFVCPWWSATSMPASSALKGLQLRGLNSVSTGFASTRASKWMEGCPCLRAPVRAGVAGELLGCLA